MKSAPVTVVPGIRASSRTDAELVTGQVHDSATHRPSEPSRPSKTADAAASVLRSDRRSRSQASCRSRQCRH